MNRRSYLQLALAGGTAAAGNLLIMRDLFAQGAGGPIIIGHQSEVTGAMSSWGFWMEKAARAAVDHVNQQGGIAGRPVQLVVEDTESNPAVGARKFRSLVERSRADFVLGSVHSGANLATAPIAKELKIVYFPCGMAEEKTGEKGNRYIFQVGSDTYSQAAAGAQWVTRNLGNDWAFVFPDYAWGWSHYNEHRKVIEKAGGKAEAPIAVPLDAKDYLPYLARVRRSAKPMFQVGFGNGAIAMLTQSRTLGLHKSMPFYSVICTLEAISMKDVAGATEGMHVLEYHPRMLKYKDTPANRRFTEIMGIDPADGREVGGSRTSAGNHHWSTWESVFFIKEAVEKSGWKSAKDTPDFIQALEGMRVEESFEHPQGAKRIRPEDHKSIQDFYMSRVENGEVHVKDRIAAADVETRMPPKVDFTKEAF